MRLRNIPIDEIDEPSFDVRSQILLEGIEELAESIRQVGLLQPLRVFEKDGRYEVEDGHRRYLAAKMAGLQQLPCFVVKSDEYDREVKKLHANLNREDLTVMDVARTLGILKEKYGYTLDDLSRMMRKSTSRILQILAFLNYDPTLQEAVQDKKISEHIARSLQQIPDKEKRDYYLQYCLNQGATLETVRSWVQREKIETGHIPISSTLPNQEETRQSPVQVVSRCSWCRRQAPADSFLLIRVCGECYTDARKVFDQTRHDRRIELGLEGEGGHEKTKEEANGHYDFRPGGSQTSEKD